MSQQFFFLFFLFFSKRVISNLIKFVLLESILWSIRPPEQKILLVAEVFNIIGFQS